MRKLPLFLLFLCSLAWLSPVSAQLGSPPPNICINGMLSFDPLHPRDPQFISCIGGTPALHRFHILELPNSSTQPFGINNAGEIVGTGSVGGFSGFKWTAGNVTTTQVQSASGPRQTVFYDINTTGDIVGSSSPQVLLSPPYSTAFLLSGGNFTPIDPTSNIIYAEAHGINDAGDIVGIYNASGFTQGFLLSGGNLITLDNPPGGLRSVNGINDAGQIVGSSSNRGFIMTGADFEIIDLPNFANVDALGINNLGQVVGTYGDLAGQAHSFLKTGNNFITFEPFTSQLVTSYSQATAINDVGQIVGFGFNVQGTATGFVTTFAGSSPTDPILPNSNMSGIFRFLLPLGGQWYDPPLADGFTYTLTGGGTFTEVGAPPATFGFGPVQVIVGGSILDTLDPGEHFLFAPGVTTFSLQGISPLVDAADPTVFPTFLDFTGTPTSLTMAALVTSSAVPEPSTWFLLATGCVGLLGYGWRTRR